jgi:outer membrane receptor for ferrienterochelin and colicins
MKTILPLLLLFCSVAFAQDVVEEPSKEKEPVEEVEKQAEPRSKEEEVVITATRRKTLLSDTPEVMQVVGSDDIEEVHPSNIGDVMETLPGVSVETGTGSGLPTRSIISLNALPANYTLVLVNGARLLSDHIHSGQNIEMVPTENIERIEIIRSAASAQYGTDAIGGVVNIITKRATEEPATKLYASVGSYYMFQTGVTILQPVNEHVRISAAGHREQGDGLPLIKPSFRDGHMSYERNMGTIRGDFTPDEATELFAWYHGADNTTEWRERVGGTTLWTYKSSTLDMSAVGGTRRFGEDFELFAQVAWTRWDSEINMEKNEWVQPEMHLTWFADERNIFTGGPFYRNNSFQRSAAVGLPDQYGYGAFLQHEWRPEDNFCFMTAIRVDSVEDVDTAVCPKVSAVWEPSDLLLLRGSVARGFHAPTLQELYEVAYGHDNNLRYGNPELDPEYSVTGVVGAEISPTDDLQFMLLTQYSDINDMIIPVFQGYVDPLDPTSDRIWQRQNIEDAWVFSIEASVRYQFLPWLRGEGGYTWTDNEDEESGRQLPYDPGASVFLKARAEYDLTESWTVSGFAMWRRVYDRSAWSWKPASGIATDNSGLTTDLEDYDKVDVGISLHDKASGLTLFANGRNLAGQDIENLDDAHTIVEGHALVEVGASLEF